MRESRSSTYIEEGVKDYKQLVNNTLTMVLELLQLISWSSKKLFTLKNNIIPFNNHIFLQSSRVILSSVAPFATISSSYSISVVLLTGLNSNSLFVHGIAIPNSYIIDQIPQSIWLFQRRLQWRISLCSRRILQWSMILSRLVRKDTVMRKRRIL